MNLSLLRDYTARVLGFRLNEEPEPAMEAAPVPNAAQRCLKAFTRVPSPVLILFGAGSGTLATELDETLPPEAVLVVCELSTATARSILDRQQETFHSESRTVLLADTSPWALLHLLHLAGLNPESACLMLNPEMPKGDRRDKTESLRRMTAAARPLDVPATKATPDLSAAAILHPDDADLTRFFAQFPGWLRELVVIWDADEVPEPAPHCACPLVQKARRLDDFASQRNRMLAECTGEKVLYLDADETLPKGAWDTVRALAGSDYEAVWFPRETLFPDESRCKAGFGLWPDMQLRLFDREKARFVRPVHERIEGLDGPAALLLDLPIIHESRLRKDDSRIREKLARFDAAGSGSLQHRLSDDYPTIERSRLGGGAGKRLLRLERNPA